MTPQPPKSKLCSTFKEISCSGLGIKKSGLVGAMFWVRTLSWSLAMSGNASDRSCMIALLSQQNPQTMLGDTAVSSLKTFTNRSYYRDGNFKQKIF